MGFSFQSLPGTKAPRSRRLRSAWPALLVLALVLVPGAATLARAEPAEPDAARLRALSAFMDMMHAADVDMGLPRPSTGPGREWLALVRTELPNERYDGIAAPLIARYLTAADIDALGRMANNPLMRRQAQHLYTRALGLAEPDDTFTPAEYGELLRQFGSSAVVHYTHARQQSAGELRARLTALGTALNERMWQRAADEVARCVAALDPAKETLDIPIRPIGLSYLDRYVAVLVDGEFRRVKLWHAYGVEYARTGLVDKASGPRILAADGDQSALAAITAVELELELALKRETELDEGVAKALRQIAFPGAQTGAQLAETRMKSAYQRISDEAEQAHRRMALYRRVVAFLKAHAARIRVDGNRLEFMDDDALAQYQQLRADIAATLSAAGGPDAAKPPARTDGGT
jgi:hypothetical protein